MSVEVIKAIAESPADCVLVTVVATQGSSPRHAGARMALGTKGESVGTIGGGRAETEALECGTRCLADRRSRLLVVQMRGAEATGSQMICGGSSTMLVECVRDRGPYRAALDSVESGRRVVLVKRIAAAAGPDAGAVTVTVLQESGPTPWDASVDPEIARRCMASGAIAYQPESGVLYDPVLPPEKLLILGGGHVGRALASVAVGLDFEVTVVDDREEFASAGRFATGVRAVRSGYADAIASFPFTAATYVVIVTHGHQFDLECLRAVLRRPYRYAGFIASARKAKLLREQAIREGFDPAQVAAVRAPIGMGIGAETPAEIAVSILAEMIAARRNVGSQRTSEPGSASAPS